MQDVADVPCSNRGSEKCRRRLRTPNFQPRQSICRQTNISQLRRSRSGDAPVEEAWRKHGEHVELSTHYVHGRRSDVTTDRTGDTLRSADAITGWHIRQRPSQPNQDRSYRHWHASANCNACSVGRSHHLRCGGSVRLKFSILHFHLLGFTRIFRNR